MNDSALELRYEIAKSLAREAGELASRRFRDRDFQIGLKAPQDYLTEVDKQVEKLIFDKVGALFPDDGYLGEEGAGRAAHDSAPIWVVDPIDGTANFAHGVPQYCISIAVLRDGQPEIGVIYAPEVDELFVARRGAGAFVNGKPMKAAATDKMAAAIVEIGWNARSGAERYLGVLSRVITAGASPTRAGSGALGLAYVAAGRRDGYIENFINSWDCLAAVVMIREAGGYVSDFLANEGLWTGNAIVAAAPGLSEAVLAAAAIPGLTP